MICYHIRFYTRFAGMYKVLYSLTNEHRNKLTDIVKLDENISNFYNFHDSDKFF